MQAEAVDTPFSPSSDPTSSQITVPTKTAPIFSLPAGNEAGKIERARKDTAVQSTGSGGLDAIIDREASEGDSIRDSAQHGNTSSLCCCCYRILCAWVLGSAVLAVIKILVHKSLCFSVV